MDLQSRKIEFIQEFLKLESEEIILRLEKLLQQEKQTVKNKNVQPLTEAEFKQRIDKSMDDFINRKLTEGNELLAQIEKWS